MDRSIDLTHLGTQGARQRHRAGLHHQNLLAELPCRGAHLGADETGTDEEEARALFERFANRLAVAQRAQGEDVLGVGYARKPARRAAQAKDEHVERDLIAAFEGQGAPC